MGIHPHSLRVTISSVDLYYILPKRDIDLTKKDAQKMYSNSIQRTLETVPDLHFFSYQRGGKNQWWGLFEILRDVNENLVTTSSLDPCDCQAACSFQGLRLTSVNP